VFLSSFKRADELALAMEARGYRPDAPVRKKKHDPWSRGDVAALIVCAVLCALEVVL